MKEWFSYYVNPRQVCVYCMCPFWTLTPWKSWYCKHPNCQEVRIAPLKDWS